jgi:hypothetical protein
MSQHFWLSGLVLVACVIAVHGETPAAKAPAEKSPAAQQFERLKKLAGTWVKADKDGKPTDEVASVLRVTAGGSAVEETIFPGSPMEMVSLYHLDGSDLVMTHYCVLGNQPRLKADLKAPSNKFVWEFVGGTNLDVAKDKHMHSATLTVVDDNHIELQGEGWQDGKPCKECCGKFTFVRKK